MSDPSLLVTRPTAGDPSLAPAGRDLLYILAPAPNLAVGVVDWAADGEAYAHQVVAKAAERLLPGLADDADVLDIVTPADWARQGMAAGSPFALAHTFSQTGPFRPANTVRGIDNAVLAGGSTVPGVGVPTALLSGKLAAERITGPVDDISGKRTITRSEAGSDDPHRVACRRDRGRTAARVLPLLPPAQRPARANLLPGHPPAGTVAATCGARPVRVRPLRRRHPRRPATRRPPSPSGRPAWTPCRRSSSAAPPTPASPCCPRCCTPPAPTASRWTCSTTSSPRCGWT